MSDGWQRIRPKDESPRSDKPGQRWELSPKLDIDAFNLNVAILEPDERLSQNHFHYHENQEELIYVAAGCCQVEVADDQFVIEQDDAVRFDAGEDGVHLVHNPFDEPCRIIAIGWPPEGRYPVEKVKTRDELLAERE
ncbi:cupin domain-containing protein [Natrinema sp. 1APR25-10V2]|uniref:cupin domain-containing protein n=1 Tax=Natrinema sp. 1APR25-10V2 TaxID=2951081 RepID=UPI0028741025|nr:cupin domain-containing protein [Natrinema sp. 1APR25-10V2]MDS0476914.1 cupin domain-containing protein [Natrinema sp. 1APR25-10V2]